MFSLKAKKFNYAQLIYAIKIRLVEIILINLF